MFAAALSAAAAPAAAGGAPPVEGPFAGTLPCADCEGIRTELTLVRDAASGAPARFLLRRTYLGKPAGEAVFESMGPWQEIGAGTTSPGQQRLRIDPYQPNERLNFLRVGPTTLELLDRQERRIRSRANLTLERVASSAPAEPPPARQLLAGTLRRAGPQGLRWQPCGSSDTQRVVDVSPESMITAVLTDLGLDRRDELYVEAFGRIVDGAAQIERLNRAGGEMRCPDGAGPRWQAQGNEPFWALRAEADRLTFTQPDPPQIVHPPTAPTWRWRGGRADRATAHLNSQTESGRIEATLEPGICRDTMADAAFGYRAQVTVAGAAGRRTFRGCAWLGAGTTPP